MSKIVNEAKDPGLGTSYQKTVTRILNEDGTFNIERVGTMRGYRDFYKYLVDLSTWKFAGFLSLSFLILNAVFAFFYWLIGVQHLSGVQPEQHPFVASLFFSAQTFTTVGYGAIAPRGNLTSVVASIEAFVGLIAFAIATGLIYGRFSKPSAKIAFTHNVIISPYKEGNAVMFKLVNLRNSVMLNTRVTVMLSMIHQDANQSSYIRNYFSIPIETDFVRFFPLTWTIVHPLNEDSPLYNLSLEEIQTKEAEILILVEGFDETFSQMVIQKHSYAQHQWLENVKFKRNFAANDSGKIVLNIRELNELEAL